MHHLWDSTYSEIYPVRYSTSKDIDMELDIEIWNLYTVQFISWNWLEKGLSFRMGYRNWLVAGRPYLYLTNHVWTDKTWWDMILKCWENIRRALSQIWNLLYHIVSLIWIYIYIYINISIYVYICIYVHISIFWSRTFHSTPIQHQSLKILYSLSYNTLASQDLQEPKITTILVLAVLASVGCLGRHGRNLGLARPDGRGARHGRRLRLARLSQRNGGGLRHLSRRPRGGSYGKVGQTMEKPREHCDLCQSNQENMWGIYGLVG